MPLFRELLHPSPVCCSSLRGETFPHDTVLGGMDEDRNERIVAIVFVSV
jgi:hypothetical protein